MSLDPGTKLGRYEIRSQLGAGGMGEVYRARDTQLGRDVAIKVLPPTFSVDQVRLRRFEQEACAAGALNHPNILIVHDIGTHDGAPYVVSELLEGETLRKRIGGTPLAQRRAIDYALQIANGLAAAHEKGIVHRDLKPDNVFVTNDNRVKILDFGLAKLTQADGNQAQTDIPTRRVDTDPGVVMGTVGYMSPEQLKGRSVDQRSDIFSFGTILYEMLSGRRAFHGESAAETMSAVLKEDPPELSDTNKSVSPALERLVNHCLEKNRQARFHSARDLAFALEAISGSSAPSESTLTISTPARSKVGFSKHLAWIVAAILALLLLATLPFVWLYFRKAPEVKQDVRLTIPAPQKGVINVLSISPDGSRVVYGAPNAEGKNVLWMRPLNSTTPQPLPGSDNPFFTCFWSPDSRYVAFVSSTDNKLKKIDTTGGPPQALANAPNGRGGTWNSDGVIVFAPSAEGPLYRISAAGGEITPVTQLDESTNEISHRYPWFLPDGKHFLYFVRGAQAEGTTVRVGSLDSKETKLLLHADSGAVYSDGYLLYVRDGTLMAHSFDPNSLDLKADAMTIADAIVGFDLTSNLARFAVSSTGVLVYYAGSEFNKVQLTWLDREGKQTGTVGPPGGYGFMRLSPDEKRLVLAQRDPSTRWDLWIMSLPGGSLTRFTFNSENEVWPTWSHDGTRIAFSSNPTGRINLYEKFSSGAGNDEELLGSNEAKFVNDWSRDGNFILYHVLSPKTRADLWVLPLSGDRKPNPFLVTPAGEREACFSPNGRWIAYTSDETGPREVFVQSFPTGRGKWQISNGGGGPPQWSGDAKELFYVSGGGLMAVDVKTDGEVFESSMPKPLFEIRGLPWPGSGGFPGFAVTKDGRRFLVGLAVDEPSATPITVILNWSAALKR